MQELRSTTHSLWHGLGTVGSRVGWHMSHSLSWGATARTGRAAGYVWSGITNACKARDSSPEPRSAPRALASKNTHGVTFFPTLAVCSHLEAMPLASFRGSWRPALLSGCHHPMAAAFPGKPAVCTGGEGNIPHPPYLSLQNKQDFLLQSSCHKNPACHPLPAQEKPLYNSPAEPYQPKQVSSLETPTYGSSWPRWPPSTLQGAQAQQQPPSLPLPHLDPAVCAASQAGWTRSIQQPGQGDTGAWQGPSHEDTFPAGRDQFQSVPVSRPQLCLLPLRKRSRLCSLLRWDGDTGTRALGPAEETLNLSGATLEMHFCCRGRGNVLRSHQQTQAACVLLSTEFQRGLGGKGP